MTLGFSAGSASVGTNAAYSGLDFSGVPNLRKQNKKRLQDINATTQYLQDSSRLNLIKLYGSNSLYCHWAMDGLTGRIKLILCINNGCQAI